MRKVLSSAAALGLVWVQGWAMPRAQVWEWVWVLMSEKVLVLRWALVWGQASAQT